MRLPLVLGHMRDRVPLIQDLPRHRAELLQAPRHPPVPDIRRVSTEQPQRVLIVTGGRHRDRRTGDERLGLRRFPLPRVLIRERGEPPYQFQPWLDRVDLQEPGTLLRGPSRQHRLEYRRRRVKVQHSVRQHQMRNPGKSRHAKITHDVASNTTLMLHVKREPVLCPRKALSLAARLRRQHATDDCRPLPVRRQYKL